MTYFRDWFGRDADYGYTYYDPKRRSISWDKGYNNYSDFFFGGGKKINMEEAASLMRTMSKVMGVDYSKFRKHHTTEGVKLPTHMLGTKSTDVFIGAALQNMAKYVHQSHADKLKEEKLTKGQITLRKLVGKILNEERVNKLMAEETPGYLRFVEKYKKDKYKERPAHANDKQHLIDLFDRIIRYPEDITEEELEKFSKPIEVIKKVISKAGGIPTDYDACHKLAAKITKVIETYVEPEEEEEKPESEDGTDGDDDESEGGSGFGRGGDGGDGSGGVPPDGKPDEEFLKELMKSFEDKTPEDDKTFDQFMEELKHLDELATGSSLASNRTDIIKMETDKYVQAAYDRAKKEIDMSKAHVLATLLRRKNRDYQFALKSMRSGRLDTNKLAEAKQGVSTIYERIGQVQTNKLCVGVLVDESGSMSGSKADAARKAAIFLDEALKGVPDVELFIYGHTADTNIIMCGCKNLRATGSKSTQLLVYKEPGIKTSSQLGSIDGRYENRDGAAIIAAAKRMRTFTQNQGVFVIISDGCPYATGYSGDTARKHTQKMALEAESMGFEVIQVTIGGYRSRDMFKNVIDLDDVRTFPEKFVGFLKKKVNTLIKAKVTL